MEEHVHRLNAFLDSVGEGELSKCELLSACKVRFAVNSLPGKPRFELVASQPAAYPWCAGRLIAEDEGRMELSNLNRKLEENCSLLRAVPMLGRALGTELDWVAEAVQDGGGDSEDEEMQEAASEDGSEDQEDDEVGRRRRPPPLPPAHRPLFCRRVQACAGWSVWHDGRCFWIMSRGCIVGAVLLQVLRDWSRLQVK